MNWVSSRQQVEIKKLEKFFLFPSNGPIGLIVGLIVCAKKKREKIQSHNSLAENRLDFFLDLIISIIFRIVSSSESGVSILVLMVLAVSYT